MAILVASQRFWTHRGDISGAQGRPGALPGACQSIPGRAWDAPASPWELLWRAEASREGPGTDFGRPRECFGVDFDGLLDSLPEEICLSFTIHR